MIVFSIDSDGMTALMMIQVTTNNARRKAMSVVFTVLSIFLTISLFMKVLQLF